MAVQATRRRLRAGPSSFRVVAPMAIRIESQAEPLPGYRLIERLGGGGFGEVWKAEAPGGLFKAIKFVYGDLQAADDDDGARAEQEFKALDRVKNVRHPYILSLEQYRVIDGQLIIVMELADRTLYDRFRECRSQGLPGIPREELIGYVQETAEALDLMNSQDPPLQHLDIKPQNLFLVYNHVKVADFGLVKDLEGTAATVTGGVTPVYAAPETFDGWVSRFSDQYSLAIVYQELLTGQRPFSGSTMRQLVLQHLQGAPDLSSLPLADRPIIAKALSKNPDDRYPTCMDLAHALRNAPQLIGPWAPTSGFSQETSPGSKNPSPAASPEAGDSVVDPQITREARGRRKGTAAEAAPGPTAPEEAYRFQARRPAKAPRPPQETPPEAEAAEGTITPAQGRLRSLPETRSEDATGILQPAVILGLGHFGRAVLRSFRKEMTEQFGPGDTLPHVRLLYLDTDPESIAAATQGTADEALKNSETLLVRLHRASHYLKPRQGKEPLENWLNPRLLYRIPRQQNFAGVRALGRLAFMDNFRLVFRRLEADLAACTNKDNLIEAMQRTGLEFRNTRPRVYLVTSLAGGTGSGMFLDLAYIARRLLHQAGVDRPEVIGLFLLPPMEKDARQSQALANTFAALAELNHFSRPTVEFTARYDADEQGGSKLFREGGAPLQRCLFLPLADTPNEARKFLQDGTVPAALARAGYSIFGDLFSPLGKVAEAARPLAFREIDIPRPGAGTFQAAGQYRILWPRHQLLHQAGLHLCHRLVRKWMSKDVRVITDEVRLWAQQQWETQGLRAENLITRHQERCDKALKQSPESMFAGVLGPLATLLVPPGNRPASPEASLNLSPVVQAMDYLEKLVGVPEECRPQGAGTPEPALVEKALQEASAAIAAEGEQKLAELLVQIIEDPRFRLAGAEEAIRQFNSNIEQALQNHETLARELHDRSVLIHQRIHALLESPTPTPAQTSSSIWKFSRKPAAGEKSPGAELLELLRSFPKCRYQSLVLHHITRLYVSLRGHLSDEIREIGFCRQRLSELADLLEGKRSPLNPEEPLPEPEPPAAEEVLLPQGCPSLEEAVKHLDDSITGEDLVNFDQKVQVLIRKQFRALVHVCMAASNVIRALAPVMHREAELFLEGRLEGASVVDMYLAQHAPEGVDEEPEALINDLLVAYDEAAPPFGKGSGKGEICLVCVPDGPDGEYLTPFIQRALPNAEVVPSPRSDEILIYREQVHLSLADLDQLGPLGVEAYRQGIAADPALLHSRGDIADWKMAVSP